MIARKTAHYGNRIFCLLLESSRFHGKLNTSLRLAKDSILVCTVSIAEPEIMESTIKSFRL